MKKLLFIILLLLVIPSMGEGATYWVHPAGSETVLANCTSASDPGTGYCTLNAANQGIRAGDTVRMKEGSGGQTYSTPLKPYAAGTPGNVITYIAADGETPTITTSTVCVPSTSYIGGICLHGEGFTPAYIVISGIRVKNMGFLWADGGASMIEIKNCIFTSDTPAGGGSVSFRETSGGMPTHIWFHDNQVSKAGGGVCGDVWPYYNNTEGADLVRIGYENDGQIGEYFTVENNAIAYGGHSTLSAYNGHSIFRGNTSHNEPWVKDPDYVTHYNGNNCAFPNNQYGDASFNGYYGHRNFSIDPCVSDTCGDMNNLYEGNRIGFGSANYNNSGAECVALAAPGNVFRYNQLYGCMQTGLYFKYPFSSATGGRGGIRNRVYNNTIVGTGYVAGVRGYNFPADARDYHGIAVLTYDGTRDTENVIKNNLLYDNTQGDICTYWSYPCGNPTDYRYTVENNWCSTPEGAWCTNSGNPLFNNYDLNSPTNTSLPDLTPNAAGVRDGGTYLTVATSAKTNSTELDVADAHYFQDGTWGALMSRVATAGFSAPTVFPDSIAIGTVDNVHAISSINFATNRINLATPTTWDNGAPIYLWSDSRGPTLGRVLYGAAPDYGAYEYPGTVRKVIHHWDMRIK